MTFYYSTPPFINKLPLMKLPLYNDLRYLTIPWPSCGPLSSGIQWLLPISTFSGRTGLFTYISNTQPINDSFNSKTISRISTSFHSLQSINTSYTPLQEEYNTYQTQAIRTLAYQLDLTLETLLTTHKKATPVMMNLLDAWKLATPQKELNKIWMILVEIQNYKTLGMRPPSLQTTHNALSVVDVTISLTNALIISAKDVIEETLVITKSSASSNHNNPNHDSLWQNNKPNELESIIQTCSDMNHFLLLSLVSLQPDDDFWNIFSPRPQRINIILLLENTINKSSLEMDSQPVTPLHSPPPPHLRDLSFNIFLRDNLDSTFNKTGKMMTETTTITLTMSPGQTSWENASDIKFDEDIESNKGDYVMNIEWDYSYYQPWSDNKWLVDEIIAMREETLMAQNENITMQ